MNAACTAASFACARPSTVVTAAPSTVAASVRQEFTRRPSTSTVHAPHCPRSQPFFVPVRCSRSRSASSSVTRGSSASSSALPLRVKRIFTVETAGGAEAACAASAPNVPKPMVAPTAPLPRRNRRRAPLGGSTGSWLMNRRHRARAAGSARSLLRFVSMAAPKSSAAHAAVIVLKLREFTRKSVAEQAALKARLDAALAAALPALRDDERIVLETPAGAAVVVLGNPGAALDFAARAAASADGAELAAGINHGPVRVVNADADPIVVGDGIAAADAIAELAPPGRLVAAREFRDT